MASRSTLFLLPGLLCDEAVWRHQYSQLSDLVDIKIANFRGMNSFEDMAQSVIDAAPEHFYLAGHSMGGRVAMQIVNDIPDRVEKLALLDTAVNAAPTGEAEKRQAFIDVAENQGMAELARFWGIPMVHPDRKDDSTLMDAIFAMVERYSVDEYKGQIKALLHRPDATLFLAKAPAETMVLCGREDSWSPWQQHVEFAKLIPSKPNVIVLEQCGHMCTMEKPEAVSQAMREWLVN